MADFPLNPIKWLRNKSLPSRSSPSASKRVLKPPAQPRKSGNIFMHLITLQKSLQSMELALRQELDSVWLAQRAASQVSLLKLEAESVGEDELAQAAGQVLAYFETVSEGRLDLDEEGLTIIRMLLAIFKDAIGDAAPGVRTLDVHQLEAWNSRYQSLMAKMRPIEEDIDLTEQKVLEDEEEEEISGIEAAGDEGPAPVLEEVEDIGESEEVPEMETVKEIHDFTQDDFAEEKIDFPGVREFAASSAREYSDEVEAFEKTDDMEVVEAHSVEEPPLYDPAEEVRVRDVIIPDAEIRSAREFMELGEQRPKISARDEEAEAYDLEGAEARHDPSASDEEGGKTVKSPVQLEEVERLKKKLLELHEKQEVLSSKMSGILGGLKKAVKGRQEEREAVSVEDLGVEQLEDIIFIGRRKG